MMYPYMTLDDGTEIVHWRLFQKTARNTSLSTSSGRQKTVSTTPVASFPPILGLMFTDFPRKNWRSSMRWCTQARTSFISMRLAEGSKVPKETLRLLPRTVIPSAAEGSPLQTGKRWVFDDEKREVLSLPPRTPVVISGVQERFSATLSMTIREKRYSPTSEAQKARSSRSGLLRDLFI